MPEGGRDPRIDDWLGAARRACARIAERAAAMTPEERSAPQGRGAGGDVTVLIDRMAEDVVLEEMRALGAPLRVLSEEVGAIALGGGGPGDPLVVVDPIDGSLNAMRGLPLFATCIAVATGPSMGDVVLGLVHDHGSGEEWRAERGAGAFLDDARLPARPPADGRLPVVMLEGATPARVARAAEALEGRTGRVRALGSLALSLCHTAGGRADAMAGMGRGRVVDVAAAQLVARETGLLVGMPSAEDVDATPLDVEARFGVAAAHDPEALALMARLGR